MAAERLHEAGKLARRQLGRKGLDDGREKPQPERLALVELRRRERLRAPEKVHGAEREVEDGAVHELALRESRRVHRVVLEARVEVSGDVAHAREPFCEVKSASERGDARHGRPQARDVEDRRDGLDAGAERADELADCAPDLELGGREGLCVETKSASLRLRDPPREGRGRTLVPNFFLRRWT